VKSVRQQLQVEGVNAKMSGIYPFLYDGVDVEEVFEHWLEGDEVGDYFMSGKRVAAGITVMAYDIRGSIGVSFNLKRLWKMQIEGEEEEVAELVYTPKTFCLKRLWKPQVMGEKEEAPAPTYTPKRMKRAWDEGDDESPSKRCRSSI
jgi:hypothetical protein